MSEGFEPRPFDLSLFSLEGRTGVITGASRNIGAAVAMGFAAAELRGAVAAELAPAVRVNALCPGLTTPDGKPVDEAAHQHLLPLVPFRRPARAEEIVGAAVYLASDAASYTTGELLIVNGGRPW